MWKFDKCTIMNIFMEFGNLILHIKSKIAIIIKSNKFVVVVSHIKILFKVIFQYKLGCNYWRNWYLIGELSWHTLLLKMCSFVVMWDFFASYMLSTFFLHLAKDK